MSPGRPGGRAALPTKIPLTCIIAVLVTSSTGCSGRPSGAESLVTLSTDTLTVEDAAGAWQRLEPEERDAYLAGEDPAGSFVTALARRVLVEEALESLGYLSNPAMAALERAWARRGAAIRAQETVASRIEPLVTGEDIEFFAENFDRVVWYTVDPGGPGESAQAPCYLSEMEATAGRLLASIEPGEIAEGPGGLVVRLDSLYNPHPGGLGEFSDDPVEIREYARNRLTLVRTFEALGRMTDSISAAHPPTIDTTAVRMLEGLQGAPPGALPRDTVLVSDIGSLTLVDLSMEIEIMGVAMQTVGDRSSFVLDAVDRAWQGMAMGAWLAGTDPAAGVENAGWARGRMLSAAADRLFEEVIGSRAVPSDAMVRAAFDSMSVPAVIPEARVFEAVLLPSDMLEEYRTAVTTGTAGALASPAEPFPGLSPEGSSGRLTRPLTIEAVPLGAGEELFSMDPSDTTVWTPPRAVPGTDFFAAFRLVEVIPAHEAAFEEIEEEVRRSVRTRLVEELTLAWLDSLAAEYGLEIDDELLRSLPGDPSDWI